LEAIFEERAAYSNGKLDLLKDALAALPEARAIDGLTIFCAGSYGRDEASEYSDIDLFFLHEDRSAIHNPRESELRLFAKLIEIADGLGFPGFSNDCEYLQLHSTKEILSHLGDREDDYLNFFTMRMLMLLESKCIFGQPAFEEAQRSFIKSYYRDYPKHRKTFEPTFLLNDISRFWKTLLLNYENKRTQKESDADKTKARVRNFKVKFSRMTTCFATVAAIGAFVPPVTEEDVAQIALMNPRSRLQLVAQKLPDTRDHVDAVLASYSWFLEQTANTTDDLELLFVDQTSRSLMFQRANAYRDSMLDLLIQIDSADENGPRGLIRTLVI